MYETLVTHFGHGNDYMGTRIAADCGIEEKKFREIWNTSEDDRTIGKRTTEGVIEEILRVNGRYSDELYNMIINKRATAKLDCFNHINPDVIPMLEALRNNGYKIALITNCFTEEQVVIRSSEIFKYFDVACLSCELGIKKPDRQIFKHCLNELGLEAGECLYVGDGGSHELEAAAEVGMKPVQACWYFREGADQVFEKEGYVHLYNPMEVIDYMK